ncbi:hypothetical protein M9H77_03274 [Catharanthus roseus]|uniref:Uncharacterized protein n=1 Tax=Catharanthus roseus TaxID=4058 RepID=A0ACC0CB98_CATRO|nr:hypothetical protein M9H77_03274 [Catharanthus roseus]
MPPPKPPTASPPPSKRNPNATNMNTNNFIPEFNWEQQQYLKAHNEIRQKLGVPPLQWDANLTWYAHSWAIKRREDCNYRNHSQGKYGESSFWMQYKDFNPTEVVQQWYSEQLLYDHQKNLCKCKYEMDGCECGHYLNIIWKTTQRLGCSGYVYCTKQQGILVFCSYDPQGNYKGINPLNPTKLGGGGGTFSQIADSTFTYVRGLKGKMFKMGP